MLYNVVAGGSQTRCFAIGSMGIKSQYRGSADVVWSVSEARGATIEARREIVLGEPDLDPTH